MNKVLKRTLIALLSLILVFIVFAYFFVGNYFYNFALSPQSKWESVLDFKMPDIPVEEQNKILGSKCDPKDLRKMVFERERQSLIRVGQAQKWMKTTLYEDVYIKSFDGLKLHAYKVPNGGSNKWCIIAHGYMASGLDLIVEAKAFYELGFNLLMLDLRGHGKSEGSYIGMGWHDRLDVKKWIEYIVNENGNSSIILYGVSMGATTVMMVLGEQLPSNVRLAIEDCGYNSIKEEVEYLVNFMFGLPAWPIVSAANLITKLRAGFFLGDGNCVEQLKKNKLPVLFIHGDSDTFVPTSNLEKLFKASNGPKEKLIIENASHAKSLVMDFDLYWDTIKSFLDKYL